MLRRDLPRAFLLAAVGVSLYVLFYHALHTRMAVQKAVDHCWTIRQAEKKTQPQPPPPPPPPPQPEHRLVDSKECRATYFQNNDRNRNPPPPLDYATARLLKPEEVSSSNPTARTPQHRDPARAWARDESELGAAPPVPRASGWTHSSHPDQLPTAYVITPTYARPAQKPELLRLCYALMHVPQLHWVVVEDSQNITSTVTEILANCQGPSITHLAAPKTKKTRHRGVTQRNAGLEWIRRCVIPSDHAGGVYFADDDNTYDLDVFEAVRWTDKVSIWPVGMAGPSIWEGPVCTHGKVIGFAGNWAPNRDFPVDMAAFSVSVRLLQSKPDVTFKLEWLSGLLETNFLTSLAVPMEELRAEPDANCSHVLAWHTQTRGKKFQMPLTQIRTEVLKKP